MSGSSGGGGGGGESEYGPSCEDLTFEAQLTSPQPNAVASLQVGDVLEVSVVSMKGQLVVQVLDNAGNVVGGLAGPDATRLRGCIELGHGYTATVRSINGGQVRVRVEHI